MEVFSNLLYISSVASDLEHFHEIKFSTNKRNSKGTPKYKSAVYLFGVHASYYNVTVAFSCLFSLILSVEETILEYFKYFISSSKNAELEIQTQGLVHTSC